MTAPLKDQRPPRQEPQTTRAATVGFLDAPDACFRLRPSVAAVARGFIRMLARAPEGVDRFCIVPAFAATPLTAVDPGRRARLRYHQDDAAAERVGPFARISSEFRVFHPSYPKATLNFEGAALRPEGGRLAVRKYRKLIKFARAADIAFDGETLRRHPELALGFFDAEPVARAARERSGPATAVVLHLHYFELWPEFATLLKRWRTRFQLFVTLTRDDPILPDRIGADFPGAMVEVLENKGRDVRPFLHLLERGALDPYDLVCKIHGKRSLRTGVSPLFGELFRRAALLDLIGDDARVEDIQNRFTREPNLGLVGPERFCARSRHGDPAEIMGASRVTIEALARRMGAEISPNEYDVFHGAMFWVRPQALGPLRALGLAQDAFSPEAGREDGAMEHAVEGVFNLAARAAGFKVAGTSF